MKKKIDTNSIVDDTLGVTNEELKELGVTKEKLKELEDIMEFKKFMREKVDEIKDKYLVSSFLNVQYTFLLGDIDNEYDKMGAVLSTQYSHQYKEFMLTVHKNAFIMWQRNERKRLIDGIIHELCHIHTIKLSDMALNRFITRQEVMDESELLTETIAQYIRNSMISDIIYK